MKLLWNFLLVLSLQAVQTNAVLVIAWQSNNGLFFIKIEEYVAVIMSCKCSNFMIFNCQVATLTIQSHFEFMNVFPFFRQYLHHGLDLW